MPHIATQGQDQPVPDEDFKFEDWSGRVYSSLSRGRNLPPLGGGLQSPCFVTREVKENDFLEIALGRTRPAHFEKHYCGAQSVGAGRRFQLFCAGRNFGLDNNGGVHVSLDRTVGRILTGVWKLLCVG